jgi:hypothetical protein
VVFTWMTCIPWCIASSGLERPNLIVQNIYLDLISRSYIQFLQSDDNGQVWQDMFPLKISVKCIAEMHYNIFGIKIRGIAEAPNGLRLAVSLLSNPNSDF